MTVKMYYYYEVAEEKQEEYLKFVVEELKPFFVAHGARSYDVYQSINSEKSTPFVAEMVLDDETSMRKMMKLHRTDSEYKAMVNRFFAFVTEPGVKPGGGFVQKIGPTRMSVKK